MVGQKNILKWVDSNKDNFPHFIVLIGPGGSGKRLLTKTIANKISCVYAECEIRVDAVREVIDNSYQTQTKVMYCFADADNMKAQAKNAMLKITEEPPKNAYFCLTITDDSSLLDTIRSRAYVFNMDSYSRDELRDYYYQGEDDESRPGEVKLFCDICSTPGEIDMLKKYGKEFYDYVQLVVDNIAVVEPANAFKSSVKLALKSDDGYDLGLFFKTFIHICSGNLSKIDDVEKWCKGILVTSKSLNKVNKMGVNKQQLYDKWVFNIREVWL